MLALFLAACGATPPKTGTSGLATTSTRAAPPHPFPHAEKLVGYSGDRVRALLGKPALIREDKPAQYWQYVSESCTLGLFLYEDQTSFLTVEHFAVFSRNGSYMTAGDCLYALLVTDKQS